MCPRGRRNRTGSQEAHAATGEAGLDLRHWVVAICPPSPLRACLQYCEDLLWNARGEQGKVTSPAYSPTHAPPHAPPPQIFLHADALDASHTLGFTLDLYYNVCLQVKVHRQLQLVALEQSL